MIFLKKYIFSLLFAIIVTAFIIALPLFNNIEDAFVQTDSDSILFSDLIVLDAGHGGEDSGAIGRNGVLEKDINLAVTMKTADFLKFFGYDVLLTRETDKMTCDDNLDNQRKRKVSDIKNRLSLLENTDCACFISIHQNFFGGSAHGAQIFYGKNEYSKKLAEYLQSGITSMVQNDNTRVIKPITDDVYLIYNATKPAVLAECGFISDKNDSEMLINNDYQSKMAFAISSSTLKYLTEREW